MSNVGPDTFQKNFIFVQLHHPQSLLLL